jgi:hypothetical protein
MHRQYPLTGGNHWSGSIVSGAIWIQTPRRKRKSAQPKIVLVRNRLVREHPAWSAPSPSRAARIAEPCCREDLIPPASARGARSSCSSCIPASSACISTPPRDSSAPSTCPSAWPKKMHATRALSTLSEPPLKRIPRHGAGRAVSGCRFPIVPAEQRPPGLRQSLQEVGRPYCRPDCAVCGLFARQMVVFPAVEEQRPPINCFKVLHQANV